MQSWNLIKPVSGVCYFLKAVSGVCCFLKAVNGACYLKEAFKDTLKAYFC